MYVNNIISHKNYKIPYLKELIVGFCNKYNYKRIKKPSLYYILVFFK